ncbi:hypothetical protein [Candidatus Uabimicrobium sp. HlEnr_7]|uniref:GP88 family protein n=1 Tax=Candidatus Uabimicrobium helgolandensis TaxID=3095367 RepID=UPI0035576D06
MPKQLLFLSWGSSNPKVKKCNLELGYITAILNLSPHYESQVQVSNKKTFHKWIGTYKNYYNVCPFSSRGCRQHCLHYSGRSKVFEHINRKRMQRTRMLLVDPTYALQQIIKDIHIVIAEAKKNEKLPAVRLNGTSDLAWECLYFYPDLKPRCGSVLIETNPNDAKRYGVINIFDMFPSVQFWDYTKRSDRDFASLTDNYSLTFSKSEANDSYCKQILQRKHVNVAVVFRNHKPKTFWGYQVIDGDKHDLRFLDSNPQDNPVIVGLKAKGNSGLDQSGFVIDVPNSN